MADKFRISILAGGLVRISTDKISAANHVSADRLVRAIEADLGGDVQVEKRKPGSLEEHEGEKERETL